MCSFFRLGRKDREYIGTGRWINGGRTGEPAKCGQHGIGLSEVKAGESQGLFAHPADPYAGMDMAGEAIGITMVIFSDVVDKAKCTFFQVLFVHFDARLFVPIFFQDVVIAFDQEYIDIGKIVPPSSEKGQLIVLPAVKKVPYDEQLSWLKILYLCQQPVKVLFVDGRRHRDAGFAKMPRFTKMKIG